ncbi:unnamed protein product, partial [Discosporangium mesarthrocarpum]
MSRLIGGGETQLPYTDGEDWLPFSLDVNFDIYKDSLDTVPRVDSMQGIGDEDTDEDNDIDDEEGTNHREGLKLGDGQGRKDITQGVLCSDAGQKVGRGDVVRPQELIPQPKVEWEMLKPEAKEVHHHHPGGQQQPTAGTPGAQPTALELSVTADQKAAGISKKECGASSPTPMALGRVPAGAATEMGDGVGEGSSSTPDNPPSTKGMEVGVGMGGAESGGT